MPVSGLHVRLGHTHRSGSLHDPEAFQRSVVVTIHGYSEGSGLSIVVGVHPDISLPTQVYLQGIQLPEVVS